MVLAVHADVSMIRGGLILADPGLLSIGVKGRLQTDVRCAQNHLRRALRADPGRQSL